MTPNRQVPATRGASGRGAHSAHERLARGLGYFSLGLGLVEMLAARRLCSALGLERHETLVRGYGVREAATGIAILMSHDPTPWITGRVVGDAMDLATLAADLPDADGPRANRALAAVAVAAVTVLDVACANGLSRDKRLSAPDRYDYSDRSGFPRSPERMRGAAGDFVPPADFRVPESLRPWIDGKPTPSASAAGSAAPASPDREPAVV